MEDKGVEGERVEGERAGSNTTKPPPPPPRGREGSRGSNTTSFWDPTGAELVGRGGGGGGGGDGAGVENGCGGGK